MTTFADLVTSTYTVTKRPDLVAETTLALKRAITKEHAAMDYPRDLASIAVPLTQPVPNTYRYTLSLATLSLYPSARKITRIIEIDNPVEPAAATYLGNQGLIEFKEKAHDNLFDSYHMEAYNYFYRFGSNLNLVAQRQVNNVAIQYYFLPDLSNTASYSDWMADMYDYAIYTHAAAEIFRIIGKSEEYKMQLAMVQENRLDIIKNEIGRIG